VQTIPWASPLAKLKYYPIRVEGVLYNGLKFTKHEWIHEVALPWKGFSLSKKKKLNSRHPYKGGDTPCMGCFFLIIFYAYLNRWSYSRWRDMVHGFSISYSCYILISILSSFNLFGLLRWLWLRGLSNIKLYQII
jgi:hypothetical protein